MPKYYGFKIYGYYLYFTSHCVVEAMHAHASDSKLTEAGSAKFFVKADGETEIAEKGQLNEREISGNPGVHQEALPRNVLEVVRDVGCRVL